jgi:hypothetical protein
MSEHFFRKLFSWLMIICFIIEQPVFAQTVQLNLPVVASSLISPQQDCYRPMHLRFLSFDQARQSFDLRADKGDSKENLSIDRKALAERLMQYFLIGVSLPEDSFWVNLRPDSPEQMIDPALARTDVGKILLEADLQLKKDVALFTSPATSQGKVHWDQLYRKAEELMGADNVTIPTLSRPWIVPDEIIVGESNEGAYVYKATLKVMIEEDYMSNTPTSRVVAAGPVVAARYAGIDPRIKQLNEYSALLIRNDILPKLNKEVNSAKRYAGLRQVYYSLILSHWFKKKFKGAPNAYASCIDSKNLEGLTSREQWSKETFFAQYQASFKNSEYNIHETVAGATGPRVRSYCSGGITFPMQGAYDGGVQPAVRFDSGIAGEDKSLIDYSFFNGQCYVTFKPSVAPLSDGLEVKSSKKLIDELVARDIQQDEFNQVLDELIRRVMKGDATILPELWKPGIFPEVVTMISKYRSIAPNGVGFTYEEWLRFLVLNMQESVLADILKIAGTDQGARIRDGRNELLPLVNRLSVNQAKVVGYRTRHELGRSFEHYLKYSTSLDDLERVLAIVNSVMKKDSAREKSRGEQEQVRKIVTIALQQARASATSVPPGNQPTRDGGVRNSIIDSPLLHHGDIITMAEQRYRQTGKRILIINADAHEDKPGCGPFTEKEWLAGIEKRGNPEEMDAAWGTVAEIKGYAHVVQMYKNWRTFDAQKKLLEAVQNAHDERSEIWLTIDYDFFSVSEEVNKQSAEKGGFVTLYDVGKRVVYDMQEQEVKDEVQSIAGFFNAHGIAIARIVPSESREWLASAIIKIDPRYAGGKIFFLALSNGWMEPYYRFPGPPEVVDPYCRMIRETIGAAFGKAEYNAAGGGARRGSFQSVATRDGGSEKGIPAYDSIKAVFRGLHPQWHRHEEILDSTENWERDHNHRERASMRNGNVRDAAQSPGGIDLRSLPVQVKPMVSALFAELDKISAPEIADLNREWRNIEKMVACGMSPSCLRLKEVAAVCYKKGELKKYADRLKSCITHILRNEEVEGCATEPAVRNMLALVNNS